MVGKSLYWRNVQVFMTSAVASAVTITDITKASEAVATVPGHSLVAGDWVRLINVQGMYDLNNAVIRVKSVAGDDVTLENEDSTLYESFISGELVEETFDTQFTTLLSFSKSGGEYPEEDDTTIHDSTGVSTFGTPSATVVSCTSKYLPDDAALKVARQATKAQEVRGGLVVFENGAREAFSAEFATLLDARGDGSPGSKVTANLQIALKTEPRYFAS